MANAAKTVVLKGAGNMAPLQQLPLRCVTVDVTGTLMGYKGVLGDYYCMAAKAVGLPCPDYDRMHMGFKLAYKEMATKYPCFGKTANLSNVDWWRMCVRNSFLQVKISSMDWFPLQLRTACGRQFPTLDLSCPFDVITVKAVMSCVNSQEADIGTVSWHNSFSWRSAVFFWSREGAFWCIKYDCLACGTGRLWLWQGIVW